MQGLADGLRLQRRLHPPHSQLAAGLLAALLLAAAPGSDRPATAQSLAAVPGVVVRSLPTPEIGIFGDVTFPIGSRVYTASPSIAVLPNGDYVITDNDFGGDSTASESGQTYVFRSTDRGQTWTQTATLDDMKRGSLFVHDGALHLMGYTTDNSGTAAAISVIRRSTDNGVTWTTPTGRDDGLFNNGSGGTPNAAVVHDGRLWIAQAGKRVRYVDATETDLLLTRRWSRGNIANTDDGPVPLETTISEAQIVASPRTGVVVMPKVQQLNTSVLLRVDPNDPGQMLTPTAADWIDLPGGEKKFGARYDPVSDRFWVLSNPVLPAHADYLALDGNATRDIRPWLVRNTAAMLSSHDLVHWDVEKIFLYSANIDSEAFQYLQFDFDGADLVVASRTAFDVGGTAPWRGHDSNLTTFHRIEDFRTAQARQVVTISGSAVLRSELTQHDPAPLGAFARGTSFAGAPLTSPTALGQAGDGDVYIAEAGGRVLRFDALGNFREVVEAAPVPLAAGPLELAPPAPGERTWIPSGGGSWADLMHWHSWNRPDTDREIVTLGTAITAAATLDVDREFTMQGIRFRSDHAYTLAGDGSLRLAAAEGQPLVRAERGAHTIDIPVTLGGTLELMAASDSSLTLAGGLDLAGHDLEMTGAGQVVLTGSVGGPGGVRVAGGTLLVEGLMGNTGGVEMLGGTLGGRGTITGSLIFSDSSAEHSDGGLARLLFDPAGPLVVNGTVSFAEAFGVANIAGLPADLAEGIYTLLDGTATIDTTNLLNLGPAAAFDLGDGRSAFFAEGSLLLHVVPEPVAFLPAAVSIAGLLGWSGRRRRLQAALPPGYPR